MSKVVLSSEHYTNNNFLKIEIDRLRSQWLFFDFKKSFINNGDYIVKNYPFGEVVVRKIGDTFLAFFNTCPHRFSKLFLNHQGNSQIECPYHGWRFNDNGIPAIPLKNECYGKNICEKDYKIDFLEVETCGEFIFIRTIKGGISLRQFLSESYDYILSISNYIQTRIEKNSLTIDANWKIVVENSLDEYHLLKVHSKTLAHILSLNYFSKIYEFTSMTQIKLKQEVSTKINKLDNFFEEHLNLEGYAHHFIFPNLAIATTNGTSFFVQEAWPISESKTLYISHGFLAGFKTIISQQLQEQIADQYRMTNRTVFNEDKLICEGIQVSLGNKCDYSGVIGSREQRIEHFQKEILKLIQHN